jgi:hypothetical protein
MKSLKPRLREPVLAGFMIKRIFILLAQEHGYGHLPKTRRAGLMATGLLIADVAHIKLVIEGQTLPYT